MRVFEFSGFRLDEAERILYQNGLAVSLAPKVFDTLFVLVENHGRVVSKERLMQEVWRDTFVEENNLTQNIFILRRTLGEAGDGQKIIETVPRRGYRLTADVREIATAANARPLKTDRPPENPIFSNARHFAAAKAFGNRLVLLLVGLLLVVFVSVSFYSRYYREEKIWSPDKIKIKRLTDSGKLFGTDISADGNLLVYVLREDNSASLRLRNILTESEIVLVPASKGIFGLTTPLFSPDGNFVYYGLAPTNGKSEIMRVPILGGEPQWIAENTSSAYSISPDGRYLAFPRLIVSERKYQIVVASTDGRGERIVAERRDPQVYHVYGPAPAWSPDGTRLTVCGGILGAPSQLFEIDVASGTERDVKIRQTFHWIENIVWESADELILAANEKQHSDGQLFRVHFPDGEVTRITNDLNDYLTVWLARRAGKIITMQEIVNVRLWLHDTETNQTRQLTAGENRRDGIWGLDFAPDDKILYAGREKNDLEIFELDPESGKTRRLTSRTGRNLRPVASPDNTSIAFVSDRSGAHRIWLMRRDGSEARQVTPPGDIQANEDAPSFSPDGRWLYYLSYTFPRGTVYKIPVEGGAPEAVEPEAMSRVAPAVSPDGKSLSFHEAISDDHAKVAVLALDDANRKINYFNFYAFRRYTRWTPDSKSLVYINSPSEGNNLALHDLETGQERQITNFTNERIERFAVARDGKRFVIARGNAAIDAVLIER